MMFNPETAPYAGYYMRPFEAAARSLAIEPIGAPIRDSADIERAIAALARDAKGGAGQRVRLGARKIVTKTLHSIPDCGEKPAESPRPRTERPPTSRWRRETSEYRFRPTRW
jgi:hypothetical protein